MRLSRTRSLLVSASVLVLAGLGWFFLAPTQIGGSTSYMITHGISMEPLLHTGDLALIRPADSYHVGEVVAYRSTLLHTVVLHRVIAIHHGHYTFKGENNDFIDPTHPTKSLLLGRMWLHIPHGGTVLLWIHKPWVAALLTGGVAMLLLLGGDRQRRRRRRHGQQEGRPSHPAGAWSHMVNRFLLVVSIIGGALFAALGVVALERSPTGSNAVTTHYTQQLSFGYRGPAKPGSVYPGGEVTTGEPVYLQLVHQLSVTATYKLETTAPTQVHGSIRIRGTLFNDTGWRRGFWLSPKTTFGGNHGSATARLDLPKLQALTDRVSTQIGAAGGEAYTLAIVPQVRLSGTVGGAALKTTYAAPLDLAVGAEALASGTSAIDSSASSTGSGGGSSASSGTGSTASSEQPGLFHSTPGSLLASSSTATNKLDGVPVRTVRWIALAGFVLFALLALLTGARELRGASNPVEHINQRYKHLIVPVSSITPDSEHPPIEVRTIEALAQLAERSERLILHDHQEHVDNYLIDDQGTLFRFQALRLRDTNGNGNGNGDGDGNGNGKHAAEPAAEQGVPVGVAAAAAEAEGPTAAHVAAQEQTAAPPVLVNGMAPLSDPVESAQAIKLSDRVTPDLLFDSEPRRPPVPNYAHWSRRPEVRLGFTLAPLLTLFAWRQVRSRRSAGRTPEPDDQPFAQAEPGRATTPRSQRQPPRGPGDRRRRDRRSN
ncbi:MAG TPA: signal peptidase I [Solirubrobacteraceae bacterium]|nr:signal peptidase I [Solirubrobacteraceae bacterium]